MLWFESIFIALFLMGLLFGLGYIASKYPKVFAGVLVGIAVATLIGFIHFLLSIRQ